MRNFATYILCAIIIAILSSCYSGNKGRGQSAIAPGDTTSTLAIIDSLLLQRQQDSLTFTSTHHYTTNYNFIVATDSLRLFTSQPEEIVSVKQIEQTAEVNVTDSITINKGDRIVVAEIRILPNDSVDSVWVQLARDQLTFGWIHESELLDSVVPDDPISQFISVFSNTHLLWMIILLAIIIVIYTLRIIRRKGAKIVHFNDIPSFYPTMLVIIVAFAATFYATIQLFAPELWRHFYFHPTLNPFSVPPLLCAFLMLVWLMPIVAVATIDDVTHHLPIRDSILYLSGLAAVCMVDYIIFTVFTLYYVGYPLLIIYVYFSIKTFNRHRRLVYFCGRCGKAIHRKGRCPHCGAMNE